MTSAELKTYRENLGLSQNWLSKRCGVRLRTLAHWEAGANVPLDVAHLINGLFIFRDSLTQAIVGNEEPLRRYKNEADLWLDYPELDGYPVMFHATALFMAAAKIKETYENAQIDYYEV